MNRDCRCFVLLLMTLASAGTVGRCAAEESDEAWARTTLDRLSAEPLLDLSSSKSGAHSFQFEIQAIHNYDQADSVLVRWLLSNSGWLAVRLADHDGSTRAAASFFEAYLFDHPPAGANGRICNARFSIDVTQWKLMPGFQSDTNQYNLQFARLLEKLIAQEVPRSLRVERRRRAISWEIEEGTQVTLFLRRERRPEQFPLQEIRLVKKNNSAVIWTNFTAFPLDTLPTSFPSRAIYAGYSGYEAEMNQRFEAIKFDQLREGFTETIKQIVDRQTDRDVIPSAAIDLRQTFKTPIAPGDFLTPNEIKEIKNLALQLTSDAAAPKAAALARLRSSLTKRVVETVRVEDAHESDVAFPHGLSNNRRDPDRVATYLAGHERWRVAERLETIAPPEISTLVSKTLVDLIVDHMAPAAERAVALDLLGELGSTSPQGIQRKLERGLRHERDPTVLLAWASFRARLERIADEDLKRLRTAVADMSFSGEQRLLALEALLLIDETGDLGELIETTLRQASEDPLDLRRRCLFAAGCSEEGRIALLKLAQRRESSSLHKSAFFLLQTSIRPGERGWDSLLYLAESIALDERAPMPLRIKACEIAWFGGADRPFRDRFVRQVLLSEQVGHWRTTGWPYLTMSSGGEHFLPEFTQLLQSPKAPVRIAATRTLYLACSRKLAPGDRPAMLKFMQLLARDDETDVHRFAFGFYEKFRRDGDASFDAEMLPLLVEMIRKEQDVEKFYYRASGLLFAHDVKMPVDAFQGNYTDRKRASANIRKAVAEHRREIQAAVDALVAPYLKSVDSPR